ncbi:MAG: 6,7-dimethyl-8-ribityllumazine synthase [Gemmatimonadota bacterium]
MTDFQGGLEGNGRRFAIVASRYHEVVTERLVEGARSCLQQHGAAADDVDVVWVPGAWELPGAARHVASLGRYDAIVAVGCVIRGETPHFSYVAGHAANGLGRLALESDAPLTFGVLTTDTAEQAMERAGGKVGNKGWEAALAALELVGLYRTLERG